MKNESENPIYSGLDGVFVPFEFKVNVFKDQILRWVLDVAESMTEHDIPNRGFAQLLICFNFFEMIGKYLRGYVGEFKSKEHFKVGLEFSFPQITNDEGKLWVKLYQNVRCGLYHVGQTTRNIFLYTGDEGSIGYNEDLNEIAFNPDILVKDLKVKFFEYLDMLSDPKNAELRRNFEIRFDYDHEPERIPDMKFRKIEPKE